MAADFDAGYTDGGGHMGHMSLAEYERYLDEREAAKGERVIVGVDYAFEPDEVPCDRETIVKDAQAQIAIFRENAAQMALAGVEYLTGGNVYCALTAMRDSSRFSLMAAALQNVLDGEHPYAKDLQWSIARALDGEHEYDAGVDAGLGEFVNQCRWWGLHTTYEGAVPDYQRIVRTLPHDVQDQIDAEKTARHRMFSNPTGGLLRRHWDRGLTREALPEGLARIVDLSINVGPENGGAK